MVTPAASAPANCNSAHYGNHFWGVKHNASSGKVSGSQANIEVKASALCSPSGGQTNPVVQAYALLVETGGTARFAAAGWQRQPATGRIAFATWCCNSSGGGQFANLGAVVLGDVFKYKASWQNGGDDRLHMIFCASDGSLCQDVLQTSFTGTALNGIRGAITTAANTTDVDLPGLSTNRANYRQILFRESTGPWGTFSTTECKSGASTLSTCNDAGSSRWTLNRVDNSHMQTWSNP